MDFCDIPTELFSRLSKSASFQLSSYLSKFGDCKTNLDRFNFVYEDLMKHSVFPPFVKDEKDDATAVQQRELGNEFFKSGDYVEALDCYTKSILTAKSKEISALAYANRSAALSKLHLYKECLTDINRALANGYPDKLKPKLIMRQKHCQIVKIENKPYYQKIPAFPDGEKHPSIQSARNSVKIMKNEKYGRYIVATRDIKIGEIISIEKPFVAMVKADVLIHCHECLELCYNTIPCDKCTQALYCTEECKIKASHYHQYECPILLSLRSMQVDHPKLLALKIVFMTKNELGKVYNDSNEMYRSDRYEEIYKLETHINKRDARHVFTRTAIAGGFFHLIKNHTNFLEDVNEEQVKENVLLMMLICSINTVDINELSSNLITYDFHPIALAIYSFFTLFNHSCWANVVRQYYGSTQILRAINTIKKGEQCFVNYGPNYFNYPKTYRQNFLAEQQFFICTCRACDENWPVMGADFSDNFGYSCIDKYEIMEELQEASVIQIKKVLHYLLIMARKLERMFSPPGVDHDVKELIAYCFSMFGNKRRI